MLNSMSDFQIEISETLSTIITIEAPDAQTALTMAKQQYDHQQIILDASHHIQTDFDVISQ